MKNFAARELAAIASLDGAIASSRDPEFTILLHSTKLAHQDAYGRLLALARLEGRDAPRASRALNTLMKLEGRLAQTPGNAMTLRVLQYVSEHFATAYREQAAQSEGMRATVLTGLAEAAERRHAVVAAHLTPGPETFVSRPLRTCMRCLLDRPGTHAAIVRDDPRTYVCAACHDEVLEEYPPDLRTQFDAWPVQVRQARIVEKALSHASKHHAQTSVHARLAGHPDATPPKSEPLKELVRPRRGGPQPIAATSTVPAADDGFESRYTRELFDFRTLRKDW